MTKFLNYIGSVIALILVVGFMFQTTESIPSNAKIKILPGREIWIPNFPIENEKVKKSIEDGEFTLEEYNYAINVTYGQMKSDNEPGTYKIPPSWKSYDDSFVTGKPHYFLTSLFATKRWNNDGSWNY